MFCSSSSMTHHWQSHTPLLQYTSHSTHLRTPPSSPEPSEDLEATPSDSTCMSDHLQIPSDIHTTTRAHLPLVRYRSAPLTEDISDTSSTSMSANGESMIDHNPPPSGLQTQSTTSSKWLIIRLAIPEIHNN